MYIEKIKKIKKSKYITHYCDFETVIFNEKHYVTCYTIMCNSNNITLSNIIDNFEKDNIEENSNNLLTNFIENCEQICKKNKKTKQIFIFHNFGKFDSIFLIAIACKLNYTIKVIKRHNIIYELSLTNDNHINIIFRDSCLLFPQSLSFLASLFNLEKNIEWNHKNSIDDYKNIEFRKNLINYCQNDTKILLKSFENYKILMKKEFNIDILNYLTIPALSFVLFRKEYYDDSLPIWRLNENVDSFIRNSYHGGVVDVYKPILKDGYCYDVNSLYPYVMKFFEMPVGKPIYSIFNFDFDIKNFFGFLEVKVITPSDMYIPFLIKYDTKYGLTNPLGTWKGIYFSEEIKYALKLGYRFEYIKGYEFQKKNIFKDFVINLYDKRLKHKNKPMEFIIKLIMNSLYGRLGMSNNIEKISFINSNDDTLLQEIISTYAISFIETFEKKIMIKHENKPSLEKINYRLLKKKLSLENYNKLKQKLFKYRPLNTAVHIAAAITAHARIIMHEYKCTPNIDIYYSDTDSIFCKHKLPDKLVSNTELGKFKLKYDVKHGIFISPKLYYICDINKKEYFIGKGITKENLNLNFYEDMYKKKNITLLIKNLFFRDLKNFSIKSITESHNITGRFEKRKKIFDKRGAWVDTTPLIIKNI
jgi:hypothetical protein